MELVEMKTRLVVVSYGNQPAELCHVESLGPRGTTILDPVLRNVCRGFPGHSLTFRLVPGTKNLVSEFGATPTG